MKFEHAHKYITTFNRFFVYYSCKNTEKEQILNWFNNYRWVVPKSVSKNSKDLLAYNQ